MQLTIEQLIRKSPLLDAMVKNGDYGIICAIYDIETSLMKFYSDD